MSEPRPATPRDLWNACDALTNPTRVWLAHDDGTKERVTLPSLFDQLVEAIESGSGQKTGAGQLSKPPCDGGALSLLIEIATDVMDMVFAANRWVTATGHGRLIKRTRDVPKDLRQLASHVISYEPGSLSMAVTTVRDWAAEVRVTISNDPDRTWPMHGAACRVCSSTTVPVWKDGEETRQDAVIVHSEDGVIDGVECRFCGSKLTGDDLTQLILDMLRKPVALPDLTEAVE